MNLWALVMVAVGLSMDAFAVSVCKGLGMRRMRWNQAAVVALFFGVFQALMPLIGWALGRQFEHFITAWDHWIAFALLGLIGAKMIWEAFHEKEEERCDETLDLKEMTVMAIATSIDALAVGITFAFLQVQILPSVLLIGMITFVICIVGVAIGQKFGGWLMQKAQVAGGVILVFIGVKILIEHLGIL